MILRTFGLSVVVFTSWVAGAAFAQGLPQPGKEHELLKKEVGEWTAEATVWIAPGVEPMKSTGTESNKMLGGFWLLSDFKGEFGGVPFTGRGQLGFEPETGKYVTTWVDSMVPSLFVARGDYDAKSRTLTLLGDGVDMNTGAKKQYKAVSRYVDDDHKVFTMSEAEPGSDDWRKSMEMRYTRKD